MRFAMDHGQGADAAIAWARGALLAAICTLTTPALALTPATVCPFDPVRDRFLATDEPVEETTLFVAVSAVANDFVDWRIDEVWNNSRRAILQHCPTGQELTLAFPVDVDVALTERYNEMLYGQAQYTLRQIAEELAPHGVGARITTDTYGDCACDVIWGTE